MLEVKNLHKSFDGQEVLKGINCEFKPGINNLIIGQSGSGKTVLLKCIIGLFRPEEGQVLYDGLDFHSLNRKQLREVRKQIGVLFQGSALFDSMTVAENVAFPLRMFSDKTEAEIRDRVDFCLERVYPRGHLLRVRVNGLYRAGDIDYAEVLETLQEPFLRSVHQNECVSGHSLYHSSSSSSSA